MVSYVSIPEICHRVMDAGTDDVLYTSPSFCNVMEYCIEHGESSNDFYIELDGYFNDNIAPVDLVIAIWIVWIELGLDEKDIRQRYYFKPSPMGLDITAEENFEARDIAQYLMGQPPLHTLYKIKHMGTWKEEAYASFV